VRHFLALIKKIVTNVATYATLQGLLLLKLHQRPSRPERPFIIISEEQIVLKFTKILNLSKAAWVF
jgi:hypothetical protein